MTDDGYRESEEYVRLEPCSSCQVLAINGIRCHETGCPDAWRDDDVDCMECERTFQRKYRNQDVCIECMHGFVM